MKTVVTYFKNYGKEAMLCFFAVAMVAAIVLNLTTPHTSGVWDNAIMYSFVGMLFTLASIHGTEM